MKKTVRVLADETQAVWPTYMRRDHFSTTTNNASFSAVGYVWF